MLAALPPRERQIVDILYERGQATVSEIGEALANEVTGSAIGAATALIGMEDKLADDELDELEQLIAKAREGRIQT